MEIIALIIPLVEPLNFIVSFILEITWSNYLIPVNYYFSLIHLDFANIRHLDPYRNIILIFYISIIIFFILCMVIDVLYFTYLLILCRIIINIK